MSDLSGYREDTDEALVLRMRKSSVDSSDYRALQGELSQRVAIAQIKASTAQIKSARYQLVAIAAVLVAALIGAAAALIPK